MTPAQRHKMKHLAAAAAEASEKSGAMVGATAYELQLAQLAAHRRQLKEIQSIQRKVELKRKLLPEYLPYVDGVLGAGKGAQDDVLMTMMVWAVDVGDLALALRIGEYALAHGLQTPDQYARDTATLLAELHADEALSAPDGSKVPLATLEVVLDLTSGHDMPDEVRAKLHRAIGLELERADCLTEALKALREAVDLNQRVGAKKDIERVERALRNAQQTNTNTEAAGAQGAAPETPGQPASEQAPAQGAPEAPANGADHEAPTGDSAGE